MEYIEAPNVYVGNAITVFLAGGIGNCPDWQADATLMFRDTELAVLNPRRKEFNNPWNRKNSEEQITWEFDALKHADIVLFWFARGGSPQPIALFELGVHASDRGKRTIVGVDREYPRLDDIEIQLGLMRGPNFPIYTSLAATCDAVEQEAARIARARSY